LNSRSDLVEQVVFVTAASALDQEAVVLVELATVLRHVIVHWAVQVAQATMVLALRQLLALALPLVSQLALITRIILAPV
jgi:hypothetical protein